MLLKIIKFLRGYVKIRVYGYSPERFLNLCSNHDILIWDLQNHGNAYEMYMSVKGFRQLLPIVRKTKTRVRIIKRYGMPFLLYRYRKRKVFFAGVIFSCLFIYIFSLFIWDIRFEGNSARTSEVLLEFLESKNLHHGMWKKDIDCEKVEAMIRNEFDDIIWTSVEIKGTRLIVYVQESLKIEKKGDNNEGEPTDLCAGRAGTVEKIITRSGTPLVNVGSQIQAGDILVQGRMEIIGDDGTVMNYQYCHADADIYIRTEYPYEDTFSRTYMDKKYVGEPKESYYVRTFSRKWNLKLPGGDKSGDYESVVDEKQLHLWNNFYLPFYWGSVTKKYYENVEKTYSQKEAEQLAAQKLQQFCEDLQKKGVQIVENNVTIQVDDNTCRAQGSIVVIEKTGENKPTEVLQPESQEEQDEHNGTGT